MGLIILYRFQYVLRTYKLIILYRVQSFNKFAFKYKPKAILYANNSFFFKNPYKLTFRKPTYSTGISFNVRPPIAISGGKKGK